MKKYVKKSILFILILACMLISGCGEASIYESSKVYLGNSSSDFVASKEEEIVSSVEQISSVLPQTEEPSSIEISSVLESIEISSSKPTSSAIISSENISSKPILSSAAPSSSSKPILSSAAPSQSSSSKPILSSAASSQSSSSKPVLSSAAPSLSSSSKPVLSSAVPSQSSSNSSVSSEPVQSEGSSSAQSSLVSSKTSNSSSTSSENSVKLSSNVFKGIWISCYEFPFKYSTEQQAKEKLDQMMETIAKQGYTAVFGHVRANADAFYPSKYFPFSKNITGVAGKNPEYDPLEIMLWAAKKHGLEFHAWINPYRVSGATTNPLELAEGHIAAKWLTDGSNRAVIHKNGIYFNPASLDVQKLILDGIREILDNYKVDGIHFDDYFYPQGIPESFDSKEYNEYLKDAKTPLSLGDWRRANVNSLVSAVYRLCHSKKTVFGISPAGNISLDNSHDNYRELYADTALWMQEEGYIDYILPQLYFGYNHSTQKARYKYLLDIWAALPKHKKLKFYVGLAAYKMNENCIDKEEWHNETDLLARQATDALLNGADGIAVFSYTASTTNNPHNILQINNMFDAIDKLDK